jgi:hypothetical protein
LAKLVGKPVPTVSFPRLNDAENMEAIELMFGVITYAWPCLVLAVALAVCYLGEKVMWTLRWILGGKRNRLQ